MNLDLFGDPIPEIVQPLHASPKPAPVAAPIIQPEPSPTAVKVVSVTGQPRLVGYMAGQWVTTDWDEPLPIDPKAQAEADAWREAHPWHGHDYQLARLK